MDKTTYLFLFAINLIFISSNILCGIIKSAYKPNNQPILNTEPSTIKTLFIVFFFAQAIEIPFLLNLVNPGALLYANIISLMLFPAIMYDIYRSSFFKTILSFWQRLLFYFPIVLMIFVLLPFTFYYVVLSPLFHIIIKCVAFIFFAFYFILLFKSEISLRKKLILIESYNDNDYEFPLSFAKNMIWVSSSFSLLLLVVFFIESIYLEMIKDVVFTCFSIWFLMFILLNTSMVKISVVENFVVIYLRCHNLTFYIFL